MRAAHTHHKPKWIAVRIKIKLSRSHWAPLHYSYIRVSNTPTHNRIRRVTLRAHSNANAVIVIIIIGEKKQMPCCTIPGAQQNCFINNRCCFRISYFSRQSLPLTQYTTGGVQCVGARRLHEWHSLHTHLLAHKSRTDNNFRRWFLLSHFPHRLRLPCSPIFLFLHLTQFLLH